MNSSLRRRCRGVMPRCPSLLLGSTSLSRRNILTNLGIPFSTIAVDIDEKSIGDRSVGADGASELVLQIARAKSDQIIQQNLTKEYNSYILLTADTVVTHKNLILEKPQTRTEAISNFRSYSMSSCSVISAVVVTDLLTGKRLEVYFS